MIGPNSCKRRARPSTSPAVPVGYLLTATGKIQKYVLRGGRANIAAQ